MMLLAALNVGDKIRPWNGPRLFSGEVPITGVIVVAVFVGFLLAALLFAATRERYRRRYADRPAGLGRPKDLLDEVAGVAELTMSEKRLIIKLADRLDLPQPAALVLCPTLLKRAAEDWQSTHTLGPTKQWGVNKLNDIAVKLYDADLSNLAVD